MDAVDYKPLEAQSLSSVKAAEQGSKECLLADALSCPQKLSDKPLAAAAAAPVETAKEDLSRGLWLELGGLSYHLDRNRHFNEHNFGLAAQYRFDTDNAVAAGYYRNSLGADSHYALYKYTPLHYGPLNLGVQAGILDGYPAMNHGRFFPMALPVASVRMGPVEAEFMAVPRMKDISPVFAVNFGVKF